MATEEVSEGKESEVDGPVSFRIPKVCYQSWREIPPQNAHIRDAMRLSRNRNPGIDFRVFTDTEMDSFVEKWGTERHVRAYRSIHPMHMAARSDFFRYLALWTHGGLWLDIKSILTRDVFAGGFIRPDDACILDAPNVIEPYRKHLGYPVREQWFLASERSHPYFGMALERICRDMLDPKSGYNEYFQESLSGPSKQVILRMTGPDCLAVAIHDAIIKHGVLHRTVRYHD
eukprot:jgi/Bigna1/136853/aug1.36_g11561